MSSFKETGLYYVRSAAETTSIGSGLILVRTVYSQTVSLRIARIYLLLKLIAWNLTTRCFAMTGNGSVGKCGRLSQPSYYNIVRLYLLIYFVERFAAATSHEDHHSYDRTRFAPQTHTTL